MRADLERVRAAAGERAAAFTPPVIRAIAEAIRRAEKRERLLRCGARQLPCAHMCSRQIARPRAAARAGDAGLCMVHPVTLLAGLVLVVVITVTLSIATVFNMTQPSEATASWAASWVAASLFSHVVLHPAALALHTLLSLVYLPLCARAIAWIPKIGRLSMKLDPPSTQPTLGVRLTARLSVEGRGGIPERVAVRDVHVARAAASAVFPPARSHDVDEADEEADTRARRAAALAAYVTARLVLAAQVSREAAEAAFDEDSQGGSASVVEKGTKTPNSTRRARTSTTGSAANTEKFTVSVVNPLAVSRAGPGALPAAADDDDVQVASERTGSDAVRFDTPDLADDTVQSNAPIQSRRPLRPRVTQANPPVPSPRSPSTGLSITARPAPVPIPTLALHSISAAKPPTTTSAVSATMGEQPPLAHGLNKLFARARSAHVLKGAAKMEVE